MENISPLFILQLLLGSCRLYPLQNISADLRSVSPGENITLHCSVSADYEISWYLQNSEEIKQLVSAERGKLDKLFSVSFNIKEDHYDIVGNSSSVSLVIIGVNETDLGLYYCGGRNQTTRIQFSKTIRLTFTDSKPDPAEDQNLNSESSAGSADPGCERSVIVALMCVCSASVLTNIIGVCVFCYRGQVWSVSPHIRWRNNSSTYSVEKEQHELQYASPVYNRDSLRDTATENTESTPDSVTYAKVMRPGESSPA